LKGLYSALIPMAKDWNFYFIANDIESLKLEFGVSDNIHYVKFNSQNKYCRLLFDLPLIIKRNNIDIAHYQYISPFYKNCKTVVTVHDILFEEERFMNYFPIKYRLLNGFLFKKSAKKADFIFTVSEYSRTKISEYYNLPINKIRVTNNAVSNDFSNLAEGVKIKKKYNLDKFLLYVSRIEPRKNHIALLKSYNELRLWEKGYKLVFIGVEDIVTEELNQYKIENIENLKSNVLWLEGIDYEELKSFYSNCELFVFPSVAEGFGIPPLEAIVMNKKVLCSNATAMIDFQLPDALTFDPFNVEELKSKMLELLDKDLAQSKVDIKKDILSRYNWERSAKCFYDAISSETNNSRNV
jgi:glycosyltransferase involved in cell wall biosynthesis